MALDYTIDYKIPSVEKEFTLLEVDTDYSNYLAESDPELELD